MNQTIENPGTSKAAISYHYDIGNDFYRLFLDRNCCYSGAMYDEAVENESLDSAQERKLDYHIHESKASGAKRVLDVGCGWGGMLKRLVTVHRVALATGLTLSARQEDYIRAMALPGVEVRVESWSDHSPGELYDSIISVGAFEHFAKPGLEREARVRGYRDFYRYCHEWLKPGGWMSLQTIGLGALDRGTRGQFVFERVFPETDIPRLGEMADAAEGIFEIVKVRNDRMDYIRTGREFRARLRQNWSAAVKLVGEEIANRYDQYFRFSLAGFELGTTNLYRLTLRRIDRPRFDIRL
jgi:cyclopropane-fatty-acyl-phospholipid synthase